MSLVARETHESVVGSLERQSPVYQQIIQDVNAVISMRYVLMREETDQRNCHNLSSMAIQTSQCVANSRT